MFKPLSLICSALLLIACARPLPVIRPPSTAPSPVTPVTWLKSDIEIISNCLEMSEDPAAHQLSSSVNLALKALERTKSSPGFNQAAYQSQLNAIGNSMSKAKAQGAINVHSGACVVY